MNNALIRRIERLENNVVTDKDQFNAIFWSLRRPPTTPGGPPLKRTEIGWESTYHKGDKVIVMREPGEGDESLKNRAIEAGKAARTERDLGCMFVGVYDKNQIPMR